jgi:hypothetical protein
MESKELQNLILYGKDVRLFSNVFEPLLDFMEDAVSYEIWEAVNKQVEMLEKPQLFNNVNEKCLNYKL